MKTQLNWATRLWRDIVAKHFSLLTMTRSRPPRLFMPPHHDSFLTTMIIILEVKSFGTIENIKAEFQDNIPPDQNQLILLEK